MTPFLGSFTGVLLRGVPTQQRVRKPQEAGDKNARAHDLPDTEAEEAVPVAKHIDSQPHRPEKNHEDGPENGSLGPRRTAHPALDEEKDGCDPDGDGRVVELRRMPQDSVRIRGEVDSQRT